MMLSALGCRLVVVDVQEKLLPVMTAPERLINNITLLLRAAPRLKVPTLVSEQYRKGLGPTVEALAAPLQDAGARLFSKNCFSCYDEPAFAEHLKEDPTRDQIVLCGIEAHICVLQTALRLDYEGYYVAVVADACSSRQPENAERAMQRMAASRIEIVTTEMVLFEWLRRAGTETFRDISRWIR